MNLGLLSQQPNQQQTAEDLLRFLLEQEKRAQMTHHGAPSGPAMRAHNPLNQWAWGVANRVTKPGILRDEIASSVYGHKDWADLVKTFLGQREAPPEGIPMGMGAIMAGPKAAKASLEMLEIAKDAEKRGMSRERIFDATGWFKGADKKWRFEIDDSGARIREGAFDSRADNGRLMEMMNRSDPRSTVNVGGRIPQEFPFEEFASHRPLEQSYFQTRELAPSMSVTGTDGARGSYSPYYDSITLNDELVFDEPQMRSTLLHELQHSIQHREGFEHGSMPSAVKQEVKNRYFNLLRPMEGVKNQLDHIYNRAHIASLLEQAQYYRDFAKRDNVTRQARQIYNSSLWYELPSDWKGVRPKRWNKSEHDEYLRRMAVTFADMLEAKANGLPITQRAFVQSRIMAGDSARKIKEQARKEAANLEKKTGFSWAEYQRLHDELRRAKGEDDYGLYLKSSGETEARNVQKRRDYTADYRRMLAPWKTQDYPDGEQILLGL